MNEATGAASASQPATAMSDDVYRDLVDAVVDYAIYRLDAEGRVVSWNRGANNIKGYGAEEIIGRNFSDFFTEEDRKAGVPERALATARSKGRFESEGWRVRKDGSRFWALAILDAIYGEDGTVVGFAKITRDMTEQRLARQALEESERQFRLLVAGVSDYALYMIDTSGKVTSWNTGAERIKGYRADEIIGENFRRFYTPEDLAAGMPTVALDTAAATGRYEAEGWRVRRDGTHFWANVIIDAIRDESGALIGFAKITRDITERRDNQMRLEEARQQLLQSQKMESIGQLTGGVAHDFNNLLTVIVGGVDLARRKIADPQALSPLLDNVAEAAQRGASLTRQLLAFSRRQSLSPEPIDLSQMMPEFVELLDRSLGGDIEIEMEIDGDLVVHADVRQFELALLNVGLNARDAMPDGGRITIHAERRHLDGGREGLEGEFIAISLTDTGTGIEPELQERIFEPFFTTKEVGRGTGLGLSQAYGFAKQSGGTITLDSELGQGTTLTFLMPQTAQAAQAARQRAPEVTGDLAGRRILVVEDDTSVAGIACSLLRAAGAEVRHAGDVEEAIAAFGAGAFDLVFSDVVMPGGRSGFDLARVLSRERPGMPILLATGYGGSNMPKTAEFKILAKPYDQADLLRVVSECLNPLR
jgi:PAS domain S-box-containing protein